MKITLLAALLVIIASAATVLGQVFPAPEGEFRVEYDRFKDETTSWLLQLQVAEKRYDYDHLRIYLSLWAEFDSNFPKAKPKKLGLNLTSWSLWNDRYLRPVALDSIIDDERKSFGILSPMSRRVINGKYVVNLGGRITWEDLLRLSEAKKIEMRLGDVEFIFDDHALEMVKEYVNRLKPMIKVLP
jgi:hypothetical protein